MFMLFNSINSLLRSFRQLQLKKKVENNFNTTKNFLRKNTKFKIYNIIFKIFLIYLNNYY